MSDHIEQAAHDYLTGKTDDPAAVVDAAFRTRRRAEYETARERWDALVSSRADEIAADRFTMPRHAARPTGIQRLMTAVGQNPALLVAVGGLGGIAACIVIAAIVRATS